MDKDIYNLVNDILLKEEKPSEKLEVLGENGAFEETALKDLYKLKRIDQNREFHPEGNVWNHILMVVDNGAKAKEYVENKEVFMWACLLHDMGKLTTTKFIRGKLRSYDHDRVGEKISYNMLKDEYGENFGITVSKLVKYHMHHIYILKNLPFKNMKGLLEEVPLKEIILLFWADKLGRGNINKKSKENIYKELMIIIKNMEEESGKDLRCIGEILDKLKK